MIDVLAQKLGLDKAEIRRRNFVKAEQFPYNTAFGWTVLAWIGALIWALQSRTRLALEEGQRGSGASLTTPTERRM